ncbi:MAG: CRISPR-associated endonuclease Cas3'', partial [Candidatus Bathyarchaeia archaeon]
MTKPMPFYAHPKDEEQADLTQHLLRTADLAKILVNGLGLEETAHYTGLLHDLGKLNPYYQNLFAAPADERRNLERKLQQEYVRMHSVFSALAAYQLLKSPHREKVTSAVAAHHSKLLPIHKIFEPLKTDSKQIKQVKKSLEGFLSNLSLFAQNHNFPIDLFKLDKSIPQPNFFEATAQNYINEYIEFNTLYAALIIADRSSFFNWEKPKYTLTCHTSVLVRQGTFTQLRSEFQNTVLLENSFIDCIMVLKAPTGIGKTKMFLDIANVISRRENLERVFYFSPLLALTEDFEGKLKQVLDENALSRVLVYNHAFTGSLAEREDESSDSYEDFFKSKEYFMRES